MTDLHLAVYVRRFGCQQCIALERKLQKSGVIAKDGAQLASNVPSLNFRLEYVEDDPKTADALKEMGYMAAPVVVYEDSDGGRMGYSGYDPIQTQALIEHIYSKNNFDAAA